MRIRKRRARMRYNTPLVLLLLGLVPLYGGYYPFLYLFCGASLTPLVFYEAYQNGGISVPVGAEAWGLYVLATCHLISIPFAVNHGMAFIGFLRSVVFVLFFLYANAFSTEERDEMLNAVAWEVSILSAVCTLFFLLNRFMGIVDRNGRIDGPFQYANSWGLFQLLCLILFALSEKKTCKTKIAMAVLLSGIGLTGSRGTIFLLIFTAFILAMQYLSQSRNYTHFLWVSICMLIILLLTGFLSKGLLWERLAAIPASSSLYGRLLYYTDGIGMIMKHPMGIGKGGYFYVQTLEQTGVYTLRFIHNEYLQFALDAGIPAGIAILFFVSVLIKEKRIPIRQRAIVCIAALHACIDFDFQYLVVMVLLLLCAAGGRSIRIRFPSDGVWRKVILVICVFISSSFLYYSTIYMLDFVGQSAWSWFHADLELAETKLQTFPTAKDAEDMADWIIDRTDLSMLAWDCKFQAAQQRNDDWDMLNAKYHYLRLNRFQKAVYEEFATLLETVYAECKPEEMSKCREMALPVVCQIREVREQINPLAYRLADVPNLDFMDSIIERLQRIEQEE